MHGIKPMNQIMNKTIWKINLFLSKVGWFLTGFMIGMVVCFTLLEIDRRGGEKYYKIIAQYIKQGDLWKIKK